MKVHFIRGAARMALLGTALSGLAACAVAQPEEPRPTVKQVEDTQAASTPVTPPASAPALAARPSSTVSELQSLIQNRQVSELRTAYNGTYGASLLFKPTPNQTMRVSFNQAFRAPSYINNNLNVALLNQVNGGGAPSVSRTSTASGS